MVSTQHDVWMFAMFVGLSEIMTFQITISLDDNGVPPAYVEVGFRFIGSLVFNGKLDRDNQDG
jgi:hypothetical protein